MPGVPGGPGAPALGAGQRGPVPWEERGRLGVFGAFFENVKMILGDPEAFWSRMRPDGPLGDALFFSWICYAIDAVLSLPLALLVSGFNQTQFDEAMRNMKNLPPEMQRIFEGIAQVATGRGTFLSVIGGVIFYPVVLIISGAILHLFCMICGAAKNGFNATVRVVMYSRAPYLIGWIPVCGALVAGIWALVLTIWGIARAQDTTTGRALMAALVIPLLLACCCGVVLTAIIMGAVGASAGSMR